MVKPLVRRFPLRKNWRLAIGSPGARPAEVRRNSGDAPPESDRGGRGGDLGLLGARFEGLLVGEGWPGAGTPAAREGRPPRLPAPARGGSAGWASMTAS
jgi:hypothetical protein